MKSQVNSQFRHLFANLPQSLQQQARAAYRQFIKDPWHPSLRFKQVHNILPIYSARVSRNYRAVGVRNKEGIVWFWIGIHSDYEKLLSQM